MERWLLSSSMLIVWAQNILIRNRKLTIQMEGDCLSLMFSMFNDYYEVFSHIPMGQRVSVTWHIPLPPLSYMYPYNTDQIGITCRVWNRSSTQGLFNQSLFSGAERSSNVCDRWILCRIRISLICVISKTSVLFSSRSTSRAMFANCFSRKNWKTS